MCEKKYLSACIAIALISNAFIGNAHAEDEFSISALTDGTPSEENQAILSFLNNNALIDGDFQTFVYFNNYPIGSKVIKFIFNDKRDELLPQLNIDEYDFLGLNINKVTGLESQPGNFIIKDIRKLIPEASINYDYKNSTLNIKVPQIYVKESINEILPSEQWDNGINAGLFSYYYNGFNNRAKGGESETQHFVSFRGGINLGAWRFRTDGNYSEYEKFQTHSLYVERTIPAIGGELTLGDFSSNSNVMDSIPLTGVKLETQYEMIPSRYRSFTPVIRGVANSDALVTIRQGESVIYEKSVSAGPFELHDIQSSLGSGDYEITVKEADGTERKFRQVSSSVPMMRKEGSFEYSFAAGQYSPNMLQRSYAAMAHYFYGLPYGFTTYGGAIMGRDYLSYSAGLGIDLHAFGGLSFDVTHSRANAIDKVYDGLSYRAQYMKNFDETGTSFTMASYHYSTRDYLTFQEAQQRREKLFDYASRRSRVQLTVSQSLGSFGRFNLSAHDQTYWGDRGREQSYNIGYSTSLLGASVSLNASRTRSQWRKRDDQVSIYLTIPLNKLLRNATLSHNYDSRGQYMTSVSGSALDNKIGYSLRNNSGTYEANGAALNYRGNRLSLNTSYTQSKDSDTITWGANGGFLLHSRGITLTSDFPETGVLVDMNSASGVHIANVSGLTTDFFGYAYVPYLQPYRRNEIIANSVGLDDVEIDQPMQFVTPSKGAVVRSKWSPRLGRKVLVNVSFKGKPVPFGATVKYGEGYTSVAGEDGLVWLSGVLKDTRVTLSWGKRANQACSFNVNLKKSEIDKISLIERECN